jgi:hypothetical protein
MAEVVRELGEISMRSLAKKLLSAGRTLGPYLAIELLMPGGSLLALVLWLYRSRTYLPTPVSQDPMQRCGVWHKREW